MGVVGETIDFDHVAVGVERIAELWPRYVGDLGGTWLGGADSPGYRFAQVRFANGMKVEGLEPRNPEENDFLRRFVDASGPGPHHCTFKGPDLAAAVDHAGAHGFDAINVDMSDPDWKQAFLHPKAACGIVVQLAQSSGTDFEPEPPPAPLPTARVAPATLDHIVHLVADLETARRLFVTVLGGVVDDLSASTFDACWPGGGRLRVTTPRTDDEARWLGTRPGRLHHLAFTVDEPGAIEHAEHCADGRYEIEPEHNLGTRLVLTSA